MKTKTLPKKATNKKRKDVEKKPKEPFSPLETPAPPQVMDPSQRRKADKKPEKGKK